MIRSNVDASPDELPQCVYDVLPEISLSGKTKQNIMRLKVNRPAIIDTLDVEDILDAIQVKDLLTDGELIEILKQETRENKTNVFLDILMTKNNVRGWYETFRSSLLRPVKNLDAGVTEQYGVLVSFLDSTIIYKIQNQGCKFSKAKLNIPKIQPRPESCTPPIVLPIDNKKFGDNTSGLFYLEPGGDTFSSMTNYPELLCDDSVSSIITEPKDIYATLLNVYPGIAYNCIIEEKCVYEAMKNLELTLEIYNKLCSSSNFFLSECDVVLDIIFDSDRHHLCLKYIYRLQQDDGKDHLKDIVTSFVSGFARRDSVKESLTDLRNYVHCSLKLADLAIMAGSLEEAGTLLEATVDHLNKQERYDNLLSLFNCYVHIMHLCNLNHDFHSTNTIYFKAMEIVWDIEKISYGQKVIDYAEFYVELSHMLRHLGSITSAYTWSFKAMQDVSKHTPITVINVLCNSILCCCVLWNQNQARRLAIETVTLAKKLFDIRHPSYVKALLHCCYYLNEYQHNQKTVEIAEYTIKTVSLVYGCDTIDTAFAHLALSKALILANLTYEDDRYYMSGIEALDMAKKILPLSHPMLYQFSSHFARVLQVRALMSADVKTKHSLMWSAIFHAQQARDIIAEVFGDISLAMGSILKLLGKLYITLEKYELAEQSLLQSVNVYSCCVAAGSNHLLQAKATIAMFFRMTGKVELARDILASVVGYAESQNEYHKWMHMCYENLIQLTRQRKQTADAEATKLKLVRWLASSMQHTKPDVTLELLHQAPVPFTQFLSEFNKWYKGTDWIQLQQDLSPTRRSHVILPHRSL